MTSFQISFQSTGLVTSVGLDAPSACAAIRAKLTNPTETRFRDPTGHWIVAHQVPLSEPWRGLEKLRRMGALAIAECLRNISLEHWSRIPVLLCVAEADRPGRIRGLDDELFAGIESLLGCKFHPASAVVPHGRVSTALALASARKLLEDEGHDHVLIAGTDSLLTGPTLQDYARASRLLFHTNTDGFIPGEAAGAVLVGRPTGEPELLCTGIGFGVEPAPLDSDAPLRGDGLTLAIRSALLEAGRGLHEIDFRIADLSGEQYFFKESALALSRTMRTLREAFDLWHPAECIGEAGAAMGLAMLATVDIACRKRYAPGPRVLAQFANDSGQRAAAILQFGHAA